MVQFTIIPRGRGYWIELPGKDGSRESAIDALLYRLTMLAPALPAVLLACTVSSPAPMAVTPPIHSISIKGTYDGVMQLVSGLPMTCGNDDTLTLQVANNEFGYTLNQSQVPWQPVRSFNVAIASDGSLQAKAGTASIRENRH